MLCRACSNPNIYDLVLEILDEEIDAGYRKALELKNEIISRYS